MYELASGSGLVAPSGAAIPPFRLYRPSSVSEALRAHSESGPGSLYVLGSTDAISQLRNGRPASTVISLRGVSELASVESTGRTLTIGAGVDHHLGSSDAAVREALPGLSRAWAEVANVRVRLRASIGGNLMARRFRYEMSGILDTLGATLRFATPSGEVFLSPSELWSTELDDSALLVSAELPVAGTWFGHDRSFRPLVMLAVAVREGGDGITGRMAASSESRPPAAVDFRIDPAHTTDGDLADLAAEAAGRLPAWIDDQAASAGFRRRLAATLLRRQLSRYVEEKSWTTS